MTPQGSPTSTATVASWLSSVIFVMLVGAAGTVSAQSTSAQSASAQSADTIEPWHAISFATAGSPTLSPDGKSLAYVLSVPRKPMKEDSGAAWSELHFIDPSGTQRPFVTGEVRVSQVAFDPAGERISYLAKRGDDEHTSLYAISILGGESRRLFQHKTDISEYSWHPSGERVAFLAADEEPTEKKELKEKGFEQKVYEEETPFRRLYLVDLASEDDGDDPEATRIDIAGYVRSVAYSDDGERLVVTVTPSARIDDSYVKIKTQVLDGSGRLLASIDNPGKLGDVAFSPDASQLAMISAADLNDPAAGRLMVASTAGGALRDVLPELEGHVASFGWQDAETLIYAADLGAETEVGSVRADGGGRRRIVASGEAIVTGVELSAAASRAVLVAQRPQHPSELYDLQPATGQLRRLTDSNPWLDNLRLARQEVVGFEARDGLDLEGVLIYPRDYRAGQRYPLILVVHGGPESHFRNGWLTGYSQLGQVAAARGFAVYYPNYRGSTGRGVEFSKISQAAATAEEFDDLVDAVDHLIEIGLVDGDKVGIMGGSYGGYASAWGATYYSERFAAAIPFVGISNAISKVGTTDIPWEMYEVHHRKWLWEDWEYFAKASPIYYAKRNRTPTLILHGEDDPRVHPSQSLELYRHLEVLDQAPVRLVFYPGEGHGNSKSAARLDYLLRTLRWMEHYLKGPGGAKPPLELDYAAALPWADQDTDNGETKEPAVSGGGQ